MISNIARTEADIDTPTDRQAKIQFITRANIFNNISSDIPTEFITRTLLKNNKPISYFSEDN